MLRIIPRLDIKKATVVKGIHFEGLRVVGDPLELAEAYYRGGADEILYADMVASLYGRNSLFPLVERAASNVFIPLTVEGGLASVEDIAQALRSGADKVSINTAAVARPELLKDAVVRFGSQAIVLSVQAKNRGPGHWEVFTEMGREPSGKNVLEWIRQALDLGIGEILLSSIDKDGTKSGFDLALVEAVAKIATCPLIVSGGAGSAADVAEVARIDGVDAVAVASILHYGTVTMAQLKQELASAGIDVREAA